MRKGNEISAKEMAVLHISNRPCPLYPPLASRTGSRPDVTLTRSRTRTNASFTRSSFHQQVVGERFPVDVSINRRCCDSVVVIVVWLTSFRPRSIRSPLEIGSAKRWWWWGANDHPFFLLTQEKEKIHFLLLLDSYVALPLTVSLYFFLSLSLSLSFDWPEVSVRRWLLRCLVRCFSPSASLSPLLLFFSWWSLLDVFFSSVAVRWSSFTLFERRKTHSLPFSGLGPTVRNDFIPRPEGGRHTISIRTTLAAQLKRQTIWLRLFLPICSCAGQQYWQTLCETSSTKTHQPTWMNFSLMEVRIFFIFKLSTKVVKHSWK